MNWELIITVSGGILGGGALTAFVTQWFVRRQTEAAARKTRAEGDKIEIESSLVNWVGLIDERKDLTKDLGEQFDLMRKRANEAEERVAEVQNENFSLRKAVSELEIKEVRLLARIEELEKIISRMNEWQQKQEAESNKERRQLNEIISRLNGEVSSLSGRVKDVEQGTGQLAPIVTDSK